MGRGGDQTPTNAVSALALERPEQLRRRVSAAAPRIAELGEWPPYIDPEASLTTRVPLSASEPGAGFDAGIACAFDLIPRNRQRLAAVLHAAYTPAAVTQIRREAEHMDPDSETAWWLAACSVCEEGRLDPGRFRRQLTDFQHLVVDAEARQRAARSELEQMRSRYEIRAGVPYTEIDGGMQGAYVDGHALALSYAAEENLYFIGTFEPSLGLEDFAWGSERDDLDRPRSGPVHGSRQFVRCHDRAELERCLEILRPRFGLASE